MADYYIKCTVKDRAGDILAVGYSLGLFGRVGRKRKDKRKVISDIDGRGKDVKTAYEQGGEWIVGDDVRTVNGEYIRTDGNHIESDNLDGISTC